MPLNPTHFGNFNLFVRDPVVWPGKAPRQWAGSALPGVVSAGVLAELPITHLSRADVRAFCGNPAHSDEACFIVIMAWGGMKITNARDSWAHPGTVPLVHDLRGGAAHTITRAQWFDICNIAAIPGLGAAYFTKLMYFLRPPEEDCYIFDQWTARSANLLCASTPATRYPGLIAYLSKNAADRSVWVNRRNSGIEYENYCLLVDSLARTIGVTPESVEEAMFSGGGGHRWRDYLRVHFCHTMSK